MKPQRTRSRQPPLTRVLKGINTRIKVIERMAYGFRDTKYFFLKIRAAFPGNLLRTFFLPGRQPGDLHIGSALSRVFTPITSMLLISLVLSLLFNLFR